MSLDVRIKSIETSDDAPCEVWLKERGLRSMTIGELTEFLSLPRDSFDCPYYEFPDLSAYSFPKNFVFTVPCCDGTTPHYWTYRFQPHQGDIAMLFKLTLVDV